PDWAFLDEATSALDREAADALLAAVLQAAPMAALVVAAHAPPDALGAYETLVIQPDSDRTKGKAA
ncbi:MAG: ABC transporter ATP-binding protein/permease, partial [Alphaproteobacteria bacterium]